ncbi:MAG: ABC transporter ATP-binding protein [Chloroflexi bacterium]|nr:ABC transporter ATP-binding protein [Chloroflexota bacterium]MCY3582790.1 ABC transporter ATP-binding protein [Chloroflexota bacterium]MCY3717046.1 ABC transporter ATP-binding protein [Chloroflexota bacterium]MDE2650750.1 ABC transporter ATP-binding protein [Chloroflexota bacterium]MXV93272.1 ABC transporter ATP-binding protein [Chloroflexota bacterium]
MSDTAIATQALGRVYASDSGAVHALQDVSFEVERGQFVLLRGRSGSGKTTLLNCLGGLDDPTSGKVWIHDQDLAQLDEAARTRWRRGSIGFVFQQMGLLPSFSAYENLDVMARLAGVPRSDRRERILACLELVGLLDYYDHRPYEMSGGQQQRIAIARALVAQPQLILADEPTSELDSETTHDILAALGDFVRQAGITIFLSSHDPIADDYADRVINLRDGRIHPSA